MFSLTSTSTTSRAPSACTASAPATRACVAKSYAGTAIDVAAPSAAARSARTWSTSRPVSSESGWSKLVAARSAKLLCAMSR